MDIYVTDYGVSSSLGVGIDENWQNLLTLTSGLSVSNHVSSEIGKIALIASASDFVGGDRLFKLVRSAFDECVVNSKLSPPELANTALIFAQSAPDFELIAKESENIDKKGRTRGDTVYRTMNNYIASRLAREYQIQAPVISNSASCSGSALSIQTGIAMIRAGMVDRCICGGGDIISYLMYKSFESMKVVLSPSPLETSIKPFGIDRTGIALGEGGGFVLIENQKSIDSRDSSPICEISGFAFENIPQAIWGNVPNKDIWKKVILKATNREEVDFVLAHGTSTSKGDMVEGRAIADLFPNAKVSSLKYFFGHTLAASTVLDVIILLKSFFENSIIGVGHNYDIDSELGPLNVLHEIKRERIRSAVKLTAGFGGSISCLKLTNSLSE